MKKLLLILSVGFIFSCSKNDTAQNESGTTMQIDSSASGTSENSATYDQSTMSDSTSTGTGGANGTTTAPSGSGNTTTPAASQDSARNRR